MNRIFLALFLCLTQQLFAQNNADSTDLDELVVSANKSEENIKDIPRFIDIISSKKIARLNQSNMADLLMQNGNVFIQKSQQGGGSPIIRGMEANRVLIVVDGVRLNNAIFRGGHLHNILRFDQNSLDKIEVLYGSGSLMYGSDAMGGVLNIITKQPVLNAYSGSVMASYATANKANVINAQVMQGFKKWAFYINLNNSSFENLTQGKNRNNKIGNLGLRNYYQGRFNDTDRVVLNSNPNEQIGSAYQQSDANIKFLFEPNKHLKHQLNFQFSNTSNVPRYDRLSEFKNDTPLFAQWLYGPELRTLAQYKLTNSKATKYYQLLNTSVAYQYIEESRVTRNFNSLRQNNRNEYVHLLTINVDAFKQINKNELRYGIDIAHNYVNSFAYAKNVTSLATYPIATRYPDGGSIYNMTGFYLTNAYEKSEKWILTSGLRLNTVYLNSVFINKSFYSFLPNNVKQTNLALNASFGIVYKLNKQNRFYANIANAFRAPNVDDMNKIFDSKPGVQIIIPNQQLLPEQSITGEVGSNHKIGNLAFNANVYLTYLYNAIMVTKTTVNNSDSVFYDGVYTPVFTNSNRGTALIFGYNLNATYALGNSFKLNATYNYTYGELLTDNKPLDHIPPAFGRAGILYQVKQFNSEFYSLFAAQKPISLYNLNGEDNANYATANGLPAWYTLNYRASFTSKKGFVTVSAAIENILDLNYRLFASGISASGRNILISIKLTL